MRQGGTRQRPISQFLCVPHKIESSARERGGKSFAVVQLLPRLKHIRGPAKGNERLTLAKSSQGRPTRCMKLHTARLLARNFADGEIQHGSEFRAKSRRELTARVTGQPGSRWPPSVVPSNIIACGDPQLGHPCRRPAYLHHATAYASSISMLRGSVGQQGCFRGDSNGSAF